MTCHDVQTELARDAVRPALTEAMRVHLAGCRNCRSAQLLFTRIDDTLKQGQAWEPPRGFAQRVAARAPGPVPRPSVLALFLSPGVLRTTFLSLVVAAAAYSMQPLVLGRGPVWLVANALTAASTCAGLSLVVAGWWTRRAVA
jgi:hypothetical protein